MAKKKKNIQTTDFLAGYIPAGTDIPQNIIDNAQYPTNPSNHAIDINTGERIRTSGINSKTIIPEMYATAELIGDVDSAINTTNTVYTVPTGKVLLILGLGLGINRVVAGDTSGNRGTLLVDGVEVLAGYGSLAAETCCYFITQNLNSIIVLDSNKLIEVRTASDKLRAIGNVFGYLVDKTEYRAAV